MTDRDSPEYRAASREMSDSIRRAAGRTDATRRDTNGEIVRDAGGRYVKTGQGLDGGAREPLPVEKTVDMNQRIREALTTKGEG